MRTLKPVAAALVAAGCIAVPNFASAVTLNDFCGGVAPPPSFDCQGSVTLTAACLIKVPAGQDLSLSNCFVAGAYPMTIKGGGTSQLFLSRGSANVARFELNFGIGNGTTCGDAIVADWSITAAKVDIHANGGIDVDMSSTTDPVGIVAQEISVKSKLGDVCVTIGYEGSGGALLADKIEIKSDQGSARVGGPPPPPPPPEP